jgi:DNA methylase
VVVSRVYDHRGVVLHRGDCLDVLSTLGDASVDSVVTDPPYALEFMGKTWDKYTPASYQAWCEKWATECLRVLKPGGHLLAFGGSRTAHRLACGIEDAGFELRDTITWMYSSGFPKSRDIGKDIDKRSFGGGDEARFKVDLTKAVVASGKTRQQINTECGFTMRFDTSYDKDPVGWGVSLPTAEQYDVICQVLTGGQALPNWPRQRFDKLYQVIAHDRRYNEPHGIVGVGQGSRTIVDREVTAPTSEAAKQWDGWGTALKPASEPIIIARKPFKGTVAQNVLTHGTGGMNIDGCRVQHGADVDLNSQQVNFNNMGYMGAKNTNGVSKYKPEGRWPSNLVLSHASTVDGEDACADGCVPGCPVAELDAQSGISKSPATYIRTADGINKEVYGAGMGERAGKESLNYGDSGGASRFYPVFRYQAKAPTSQRPVFDGRKHATVKPLALMRWLVRLVTSPGGLVLDPLCGTGTTGQAARDEGMRAVLIDSDLDSIRWAIVRLERDA